MGQAIHCLEVTRAVIGANEVNDALFFEKPWGRFFSNPCPSDQLLGRELQAFGNLRLDIWRPTIPHADTRYVSERFDRRI